MGAYETSMALLQQGVATIPCRSDKRPVVKWKPYQDTLPLREEIETWFAKDVPIAAIGGLITCLDFDEKHEPGVFDRYYARAQDEGLTGLLERLIKQRTPSGGYHLIWICSEPVANLKLCRARNSPEAAIETRGEGGYFLIDPSPGYELVVGDWNFLPQITPDEQELLLSAARALSPAPEKPVSIPQQPHVEGLTPGGDYDARGDIKELLRAHGWHSRDGLRWCRPGKDRGTSATLSEDGQRFWVFSTSTNFETEHYYRPWHVYAMLEHGGDWSAAAKALSAAGFGDKRRSAVHSEPEWAHPEIDAPLSASVNDVPWRNPREEDILAWEEPRQLLHGVLYAGSKMMIAGPSKARKTFLLIDLGLSVASGEPWLGIPTTEGPVLYLNLELQDWAFRQRRIEIMRSKGLKEANNFYVWHLRGRSASFADVVRVVAQNPFSLVIIDPIYKLDQGRYDENNAQDIGKRLNDFEAFCRNSGASVAFAHHFAKGNSATKAAEDRASGSGVFARDPDALISMTPHADDDGGMVIESRLRNFASPDPFTVEWAGWLWERSDKDPEVLDRDNRKKAEPVNIDALKRFFINNLEAGTIEPDTKLTVDHYDEVQIHFGTASRPLIRRTWKEVSNDWKKTKGV